MCQIREKGCLKKETISMFVFSGQSENSQTTWLQRVFTKTKKVRGFFRLNLFRALGRSSERGLRERGGRERGECEHVCV